MECMNLGSGLWSMNYGSRVERISVLSSHLENSRFSLRIHSEQWGILYSI